MTGAVQILRTDDGRRVDVAAVRPPIPLRGFDYCATFESYEPGEPQGFGPTPDDAVEALLADEARMRGLQ